MITQLPCAVIVWDREATRAARYVVFRPCGAKSTAIITFGRDQVFAACSRHNRRLARAGIKLS